MANPPVSQKLREFFSQYTVQSFSKGQVIVSAFADTKGVYLIVSGHVKQYCLSPDGHEVIANLYKPGAFFPMINVVTKLPNTYYFEALDDVKTYRAPTDEFLHFLTTNPDILFDLVRRLYIGMDGLLEQMAYNMTGDVTQKVVGTLVMAGKRFGEVQNGEVIITQHFTHKELGLFSGTSRENVTRVLSDLHKKGLIKKEEKQLVIVSMQELEDLLLHPVV